MVSSDGENWTTVWDGYDLEDADDGEIFTVDLDALGLEYGSDFQIKVQQYDPLTWEDYERCRDWDDIWVYMTY